MPEDEPEPMEVLQGVVSQTTGLDAVVYTLLTLAAAGYALYEGLDSWWIYPSVIAGFIFVVEATHWYYFKYPRQRLQEKAETLAEGEDVNPELDMGPGLTDPYTLSLLAGIIVWGLISIHLLQPTIGRYPGLYVFLGGTMVIIAGVSLLFKKTGRLD